MSVLTKDPTNNGTNFLLSGIFRKDSKKKLGLKFNVTSNGLKLDLKSLLKNDIVTVQVRALDDN